jgi:hypothetical protein
MPLQSLWSHEQKRGRRVIKYIGHNPWTGYFQFMNQFFKQNERLTMGAPISAILAETFIQHPEHTIIYNTLKNIKS